ncbi:hypothetical protein ACIFOE_04865 [Paenibacillus sp. NRS-1783]|uniref:hypothetical protein n=1 Tax=Paenibacillus sp. NRS-1783 TaxID=3233907 RepID=UPI003D2660A0
MKAREHKWRRTQTVSTLGNPSKFLYQVVKCVDCGIVGTRTSDDAPVERDKLFADEKYSTCEGHWIYPAH